jgi:hypothetical protein
LSAAAESSKASFVDAFFFFVPYLKLHTQYVNKHPSAIDLLLKLTRANARFRRFLDECLGKTGMDAESFLILPIQRLPRYELLLTVPPPSPMRVSCRACRATFV